MQIVRRKSHFYLYCDSVKIGIIFCQYVGEGESEIACNVLCPNYLCCAFYTLGFFSHLTFSIVSNLIKESNRIEVYM